MPALKSSNLLEPNLTHLILVFDSVATTTIGSTFQVCLTAFTGSLTRSSGTLAFTRAPHSLFTFYSHFLRTETKEVINGEMCEKQRQILAHEQNVYEPQLLLQQLQANRICSWISHLPLWVQWSQITKNPF